VVQKLAAALNDPATSPPPVIVCEIESLTPASLLKDLALFFPSGAPLRIRWENGAVSAGPLSPGRLLELATPGYHQIESPLAPAQESVSWILTPSQCYESPLARPANGLNCFLPALRSQRNWGVGDLTDLRAIAAWLRQRIPLDFIALNPLHAIHNRAPYNTSPYLPLSLFARNLLLIDVEACPEFQQSAAAQRAFHDPATQAERARLRGLPFIDYAAAARHKTFFLLLLFREFLRRDTRELDTYIHQHQPWLTYYCRYMALDRYLHRRNPDLWHWRQWPQRYQHPESPAVLALLPRLNLIARFHAFVQMRLDQQLAHTQSTLQSLGYTLGLYHDLALSPDRVGADTWAHAGLFAEGVRVGSPPDDFNRDGQDWGFPAIIPSRHARSGYAFFRQSLRWAASHGGVLRLDHVMRLARLYWIPDGLPPRDGAYVRDHLGALLRILALESQRGRFAVVGEDLGTVPDHLREALHRFRVLSYRLILFERRDSHFHPPDRYPQLSLAAFTTHDLPTFDGWLNGADLAVRQQLGHLSPDQYQQALAQREYDVARLCESFGLSPNQRDADTCFAGLVRFLAATPARLRLINLEELFAEPNQQNVPGTTSEAPNWQRKVSCPFEDWPGHPVLSRRLSIWASTLNDALTATREPPCAP
jgi:4-alpha-glucanotransferase